MGARGPKPKPLETKRRTGGRLTKADGTQTTKLPEDLVPAGGAPTMPVGHSRRWQGLWRGIVPLLRDAGILAQLDAITLEMLVDCLDEYHAAGEQLRRATYANKLYYSIGTNGALSPHPAMKQRADRRAEFMRWSDRYGLDPAARTGLLGLGVRGRGEDPEDKPQAPVQLHEVGG